MTTSRRGFLRSLLALPALLAVPALATEKPSGHNLYGPISISDWNRIQGIPCKSVVYEHVFVHMQDVRQFYPKYQTAICRLPESA